MTATKIEEELRKEVVPRFPLDEEIEKPEVIRRKDRVILRFNGEARVPLRANKRSTHDFTPSSTRWRTRAAAAR